MNGKKNNSNRVKAIIIAVLGAAAILATTRLHVPGIYAVSILITGIVAMGFGITWFFKLSSKSNQTDSLDKSSTPDAPPLLKHIPRPENFSKKPKCFSAEKKIIYALYECDGGLTILDAAKQTDLKPTKCQRILDKLVKKNYIQMEWDDHSGIMIYRIRESKSEQHDRN